MGGQKSGEWRDFMSVLRNLFKNPTPTKVPHIGFCLCFVVVFASGCWAIANQFNLKALFPQAFERFYGYFLMGTIGALVAFFNQKIIRLIESRYNEKNANRLIWTNLFFGILSIYLFFAFLFYFSKIS